METKTCTRCNNDKPLSGYQIDKRREGDSHYQQPCIDCRNTANRARRKSNVANKKLAYCDIKHIKGFKDFSEEHKKFIEARILLMKAINNYSPVFVQGTYTGLVIGCTKCNHIQPLPEMLPGKQLSGIIEVYEEYHKSCS